MFRIKASTFIVHIAGWLIFMSLPLLFSVSPRGSGPSWDLLSSWTYWKFCLVFIIVFYLNTALLVPQLFLKKKFLLYAASLLALFAMVYYLRPFDQLQRKHIADRGMAFRQGNPGRSGDAGPGRPGGGVGAFDRRGDGGFPGYPPDSASNARRRDFPGPPDPGSQPGGGPRTDVVSIFLYIMLVTLAMSIELGKQWRMTEQRITRAEADKANAELSFLKAQINPHFLFNTLNNIYSLAISKNEYTADSIMKLSNIMRYVTDDATEDYVSLEDEVACIRDYIALQRLRLGGKVQLDFDVSGDLDHKEIAPLILMTFIENVFKYGISNHEPTNITIRIFAEQHTITFFSRNRIFRAAAVAPERTGIGIANTRQRLEHLYQDRYLLNIREENDVYTVDLTLKV